MSERNVLAGTTATVLSPFVDGWQNLFVWVIVAFALILGDLRFGICAARKRGEKIRGSRAVRRTINKMVDYICWVSIAWVLGGINKTPQNWINGYVRPDGTLGTGYRLSEFIPVIPGQVYKIVGGASNNGGCDDAMKYYFDL